MNGNRVTVRRALVGDALSAHTVLLTAKDEIPLAPNFTSADHQKWVRDWCRERQVWLAHVDGSLAGIMVMHVTEVRYLVTLATYRRRGVGRTLIRHAVAMVARRYRCGVKAKTRPENSPIVTLLTAEGFTPHPVLAAQHGWLVYSVGKVD